MKESSEVKITIITAVYNRSNTIERAIRSLQNQEYPFVEHIIIDGGSTDGTLDILRAILEPTAILISEPDLGLYHAINKGLRIATGEVIGLLHSDDFFADEHVLSNVAAEFHQGSFDVVFGDAVFFAKEYQNKVVRKYSSSRFKPNRLGWGLMPAHTAIFLSREAYQKFGEYKLCYKIASDFELICRVFSSSKLQYSYIPKVLVKMQTGGLSTAGLRNTLTINQEVMHACRENQIYTNWFMIISKYPLKLLEFF